MSQESTETVRLNLLSREYDAALSAARSATDLAPGGRERLERMALARAGRFAEAAAAGRAVIASEAAEPEDYFRLAEIVLRTGDPGEALAAGLHAVQQCPAVIRYLVPVIQAVLLQPALEPILRRGLAPLDNGQPLPRREPGSKIALPVDLPYYQPLEGAHPWVMGLVGAAEEIGFLRQIPEVGNLAAAILAALPRALALTEQLSRIHPLVTRADAAAYIALRFPAGLYAASGAAVDLLPFTPMSLAERPFVMVFDVIGNIFSPPMPFEDCQVDSRRTAHYWIMRAALESPACAAVVTNYREVAPLLGGFFGSPRIAEKCVFVNPVTSLDEMADAASARDVTTVEKQPGSKLTLLFTSSMNWRNETFYIRGGVDVLNAFLDLAERHPQLHLVFRSQLPENLSPRLRDAVATHPRIRWLTGFVPWEEYRQILTEADLFVMPSVLPYRNGLIQAMRWGIVPVIADCMHAHEVLEAGVTGVVVPGRGFRASVSATDQRYCGDWVDVLRATDRPADRTFFERYRAALEELIREPARIAEMRRKLRATPSRHSYGPADRARFSATLAAALEAAPSIDLSPEAVFPTQPLSRPGSHTDT
jgi:glycosyltransferase involved in cell wall biosynthesis